MTLEVEFISPLGEKIKVSGFWDGSRIWRVRFSPDLPGKWSFTTACSDTSNTNLHYIKGDFVCIVSPGKSRFDQHGPVQMERERKYLEYQDHTPFLWLADTVWKGALLSKSDEWETYATNRARQAFSVAQWIAAPGTNAKGQTLFTGDSEITINPAVFQQLDLRIETLNNFGLLSGIVPLWETGSAAGNSLATLPEDQAILLLRYMVARWGAFDVAWMLECEGDNLGQNVARSSASRRNVLGAG